jgi:hypothetical protein
VLIFIRPGVEVNAIEGYSLRADRDGAEMRAYIAIEAVLVHAEIRRGVAEANEARRA